MRPADERARGRPTAMASTGAAAALGAAALAALLVSGCGPERTPGERVWRQRCAECHGIAGSGNTPRYMGTVYADLLDDTWHFGGDRPTLEGVIRDGVLGAMPPFEMLTDEEVRAVIDHLYWLRGESDPGASG